MAGSALESRAWHIAHAGLDVGAAFGAFDELLRAHVPYAIASWSTHDPATGLFTSCTMSGAPKDRAAEARLFTCEFTSGEPSSYRFLIGHHRSAAILSQVTEGDLDRAVRYRTIFRPFGLTDELRAVLWADGTAWGSPLSCAPTGPSALVTSRLRLPSPATPRTGSALRSYERPRCGRRRSTSRRACWRPFRTAE